MYKKHRRYYASRKPDFFDLLIDIIAGALFLLGKLIFKLFRMMFQKHSQVKMSMRKKEVDLTSPLTQTQTFADESRYTLKKSLLTEAEKDFLKVLEEVVNGAYHIESQVQLSGIVKPTDSNEHYVNYHDFNLIKAKSIDFVLYDRQYKPYLAVELDDGSHFKWNRIKRDQIVDEIMKGVGLRIIHVRVSYSYDIEELRKSIFTNS